MAAPVGRSGAPGGVRCSLGKPVRLDDILEAIERIVAPGAGPALHDLEDRAQTVRAGTGPSVRGH